MRKFTSFVIAMALALAFFTPTKADETPSLHVKLPEWAITQNFAKDGTCIAFDCGLVQCTPSGQLCLNIKCETVFTYGGWYIVSPGLEMKPPSGFMLRFYQFFQTNLGKQRQKRWKEIKEIMESAK